MVFAPKKLAVRSAPVLNENRIGMDVSTGTLLGAGNAYPKALKPAYATTFSHYLDEPRVRTAPVAPQHRRAPPPPPPPPPAPASTAAAASAPAADPPAPLPHRSAPSFTTSTTIRQPETVTRASRALPASSSVRDMAYRVRPALEAMLGVSFLKFDAATYCLMSVPTAKPSADDEKARAMELAASQQMALQARGGDWDFGVPKPRLPPPATRLDPSHCRYLNPAVTPPDYFGRLRSQQPRGKAHIYFIKVDAAWYGGYAYIHLRVRATMHDVAPDRLGIPSAIPPLEDSELVLEGARTNFELSSPLAPFAPSMSVAIEPPGFRRRG